MSRRARLEARDYVAGIRARDRMILARAITLVESNLPAHQDLAQSVLTSLLPETGSAHRVGITGVPGVGKSTFIENLGMRLLEEGHQVAVLAIDPTSSVRGGSILGDKTRMQHLSADKRAFVRPSPTQGSLGGVHRKTRETMLLCEAFGFDVVLVETVGVGQSETAVADMVDTFLVLMLAGAGDELQGIKKGILEVADLLAINKTDGDNLTRAAQARGEYKRALHLIRQAHPEWSVPVLTCSGLRGEGVDDVWSKVQEHREVMARTGALEARRRSQRLLWMWSMIDQELSRRFRSDVRDDVPSREAAVLAGTLPATQAARELLALSIRNN